MSKPRGSHSITHNKSNQKRSTLPLVMRLPLCPVHLIFFATLWLFFGVWYADVMYTAQQNSFFAPNEQLMQFVICRPWGLLWVAGRALLSLSHYPLLGALVPALLLTVGSWLTGYALRLTPKWRLLQFVPAAVYMAFVVHLGFDVYFQTETGKLLGIPLAYVLTLAVQALIIRTFSRKPVPAFFRCPKDESRRQNTLSLLMVLLIVGGSMVYGKVARPYVRTTAALQRQYDAQDWNGMNRTAHEANDHSARPIAAYYAIALSQQQLLNEQLFDLPYDYADLYLHSRDGSHDVGSDLYHAEGNLHAGLVQAAYYKAMEYLTMEGPTCHLLKLLTQAALLNGETTVAHKYLYILGQTPFESDFVQTYTDFADNPSTFEAQTWVKTIRQLEPSGDSFHTQYRMPLFLGYNIGLSEGRSFQALNNSIAACLYTKLMPDFLVRCQPLIGESLPTVVKDALATQARKNPQISQTFPQIQMNTLRYNGFLQSVAPTMKAREENVWKLYPQWAGYYPYYYYFGNLNATAKPTNQTNTDHKGVN